MIEKKKESERTAEKGDGGPAAKPVDARQYGFNTLGEFLQNSERLLQEQRDALDRLQRARQLVQQVEARNTANAHLLSQAASRSRQAGDLLGRSDSVNPAASSRLRGESLRLPSERDAKLAVAKRTARTVERESFRSSAVSAGSEPGSERPRDPALVSGAAPPASSGSPASDIAAYPELERGGPDGFGTAAANAVKESSPAEESSTRVARQFHNSSLKEALKAQLNREIRERAARNGAPEKLVPQSGMERAVDDLLAQGGRAPASADERAPGFRMDGSETEAAVQGHLQSLGGTQAAIEVLGAETAALFDRVHAAHRRWRKSGG